MQPSAGLTLLKLAGAIVIVLVSFLITTYILEYFWDIKGD